MVVSSRWLTGIWQLVFAGGSGISVLEVLLPAEPALEVAVHLRRDVRTERMVMV